MSCLSSLSSNSIPSREGSWTRRTQDRNSPCLSPSRHREVELWRQGHSIVSRYSQVGSCLHSLGSLEIDLVTQCPISVFNNHPNTSPPSPTLPSSPTAFVSNTPLSSLGPYDGLSALTPHYADHRPDPACSHDLDQLRLAALTELQRSVVETGEGFVDKMRHWETHRQGEPMTQRGLKRSRSMMTRTSGTPDPMDDLDDVMVLGSASADEEVQFWDSRKTRTLSIGSVDRMDIAPLEETPSTTDDDTECSSSNSMSGIPTPSSYPDKAVSALTLALANGACGINDYQPVLDAYNHTNHGEESHVGELWG